MEDRYETGKAHLPPNFCLFRRPPFPYVPGEINSGIPPFNTTCPHFPQLIFPAPSRGSLYNQDRLPARQLAPPSSPLSFLL